MMFPQVGELLTIGAAGLAAGWFNPGPRRRGGAGCVVIAPRLDLARLVTGGWVAHA
jgi:hypothetical protein